MRYRGLAGQSKMPGLASDRLEPSANDYNISPISHRTSLNALNYFVPKMLEPLIDLILSEGQIVNGTFGMVKEI
ncbi:hypothetical protein D3C80_2039530 [compost metagenome]